MYTKSMVKQKIYSDPDMGPMPNVNSTGLNDQFKKKAPAKKMPVKKPMKKAPAKKPAKPIKVTPPKNPSRSQVKKAVGMTFGSYA